ncbi:MAG: Glucokinase [Ferruginibacter sp.]|nr:Glucokinase [Ferruginibacter sp.]
MTEKKKLGKNKILKELYFEESLSCADLAIKLEKSFPVTAKLIEELVSENLVIETGYAPSTGGRRPLMYALQKNVMYLVSVAMDQFVTKIAIMDMQNNFVSPIEKIVLPLPNNPLVLNVLKDKIAQVIDSSGISKDKFVGVGIGMPGFVNVKKGINYSFLQLPNNKSITKNIGEKIGIPVFIDNDSSLVALAELRFGAARSEMNAMVVNIGWGIGLGLILNGELFRGHDGFAGEFSHIPLFLNGKLCSCGKVGCLETETSLLLIVEKAREGIKEGRLTRMSSQCLKDLELACDAIIKSVQEGDQFAIELFSKAGYNIGKGVAVLIHLLNPKTIILSGRGSSAGQIWQAPIQQALNEHCIPRLYQSTTIEISTLGINAELIGAAALVMENYERIPVIKSHPVSLEMNLS